jgi:hypothetical protein
MFGYAGLVFVQSDVREVLDYMRDTFQSAESQRLVETTDVGDISLDDPERLLRTRAPSLHSAREEGCSNDEFLSSLTHTCDYLLARNPLGLPTEREVHSVEKGKPAYRFMLQKQM